MRLPIRIVGIALIVLLSACTEQNAVECKTDMDCSEVVEGACLESPQSTAQFCTFEDSTCASGNKWGPNAGDGLSSTCTDFVSADAGPPLADAAVDAWLDAGTTSWDIAYVNHYLGSGGPTYTYVSRIVNTGDVPLDLSSLEILYVNYDGPTDLVFIVTPAENLSGIVVPAGQAMGAIQGNQITKIAELVTEPLATQQPQLLSFALPALPSTPTTLTVGLRVQGLTATLEVDFNRATFTNDADAERISASP